MSKINIDINEINAIGLAYGELALKGKNRGIFESTIKNSILSRLKKLDFETNLENDMSKLYINFEKGRAKKVLEAIKNVFGINNISFCVKVETDDKIIEDRVLEIANMLYEKGSRTFKIETNRSDKRFIYNSMEYSKKIGASVLINTEFKDVSMKNMDSLISIDIRRNTYIYTEKVKAYGGLPLGSAGKGLSMLSGGIDSPVASFLMAKRGMKLSYVTFHSFPFTSKNSLVKIQQLVEILTRYNSKSIFYNFNILKMQQAIKKYTNNEYATILNRRVMVKLANRLANEKNLQALITGESLGQVASQTLGGLTCTNDASKIPVFRPLIGMDKLEIIEIANEIGTYKKSIEPHEDSCSLFAPKHPNTNPKLEDVLVEEAKIENYNEIMEEIYSNMEYMILTEE
ncbi:tRNA uracil 4-sulfurtransferase ThiI [Oceanivirga miroungae]|uniref:Probable tRNA sulfurtransferase n=1 Tax=Oceanivirga miroungae TaxID=1130046 RepID=A0A6I8M710_9FUSO|nr:tRNA uracil 4-sulfurtransferase ThiI [Oceanivirga miroungae]VWL85287.1 thiamine biosynthesis/tRNA modification protein ThiI [Oceanivirga miroungae]